MQYIKAASAIGMASLNGHQHGSFRTPSQFDNAITVLSELGSAGLAGVSAGSIAGPPGALVGGIAGLGYTLYNMNRDLKTPEYQYLMSWF